jgi:hypothetical protein
MCYPSLSTDGDKANLSLIIVFSFLASIDSHVHHDLVVNFGRQAEIEQSRISQQIGGFTTCPRLARLL